MESVGLEERAGGGSRSSTVAWSHMLILWLQFFSVVLEPKSTYTTIFMCPWRSGCALGWCKVISLDDGGHCG